MWRILLYQNFDFSVRFFGVQYLGIVVILFSIDIGHHFALRKHRGDPLLFTDRYFNSSVYTIVVLCTVIAILCYLVNYRIVGFIPLFENRANAYVQNTSKFMTIEVGMAPIAGMAYYCSTMKGITLRKRIVMWFCLVLNMIIFPVLNQSRGNLIANICMFVPAFVYCTPNLKKSIRRISIPIIVIIILLSASRDLTATYSSLTHTNDPFIQSLYSAYSYITCSHDNFALNIDSFKEYTNGLRMFNIFNEVLDIDSVQVALRSSKPSLVSPFINTHDMFGFFYYDIGFFGVVLWSFVWGIIWGKTEREYIINPNPVTCIVFGITFYCIAFSFFSSKTGFVVLMWYGMTLICQIMMHLRFRKK